MQFARVVISRIFLMCSIFDMQFLWYGLQAKKTSRHKRRSVINVRKDNMLQIQVTVWSIEVLCFHYLWRSISSHPEICDILLSFLSFHLFISLTPFSHSCSPSFCLPWYMNRNTRILFVYGSHVYQYFQ